MANLQQQLLTEQKNIIEFKVQLSFIKYILVLTVQYSTLSTGTIVHTFCTSNITSYTLINFRINH